MMGTTETKPLKLQELLQEQQEPFALDIYLLERRYLRKGFDSIGSFSYCHGSSSKSLQVSCGSLNMPKKNTTYGPKVLRAVYNKVISLKRRLRTNSPDGRDGEFNVSQKERNDRQVTESDGFSSASSTKVFNSCSESETSLQNETSTLQPPKPIDLMQNKAAAYRKVQQKSIEDSRQLSPVSVIEGIPSHEGSPLHSDKTEESSTTVEEGPSKTRVMLPKKITEDCIFSVSLWKVLFYSATEKPLCAEATEIQELIQSCSCPQYLKSKMVLQQTKQHLLDYVMEIVETRREEKQQHHRNEVLESEELAKIFGEKMKAWGKQSGNESNLPKLLNLDLLDSEQEWSNYRPQKRDNGLEIGDTVLDILDSDQYWNKCEPHKEIGSEIGDTILEELVDDIVRDLIDF